MIMKKAALSLLVAAASGAYVWSQAGGDPTGDLLALTPKTGDVTIGDIQRLAPTAADQAAQPALLESRETGDGNPAPGVSLSLAPPPKRPQPPVPPVALAEPTLLPAAPVAAVPAPVDIPLPRRRPAHAVPVATEPTRREPAARELVTRVAMKVATNARYADGTYTGPAADAYYGLIQIQAVVQGGRLVGIKVLQYPSDRRTSVVINRQALPMLRDEVVSAQSAKVDIISGATLTSEAFIRSLGAALQEARA